MNWFKKYWGGILLAEIFFLLFLTSFFPLSWHPIIGPMVYSILYVTTAIGLERRGTLMLRVGLVLVVAQVIFKFVEMPVIEVLSKFLNMGFFSAAVALLILQVASAREVTPRTILSAINGYLLLGLVFSILVGVMIQLDADAFNFTSEIQSTLLEPLYYGFVTFATLGYGDLLPVKPHAKSLAILIAVCGQLYLAVIIALLVGKFSSSK